MIVAITVMVLGKKLRLITRLCLKFHKTGLFTGDCICRFRKIWRETRLKRIIRKFGSAAVHNPAIVGETICGKLLDIEIIILEFAYAVEVINKLHGKSIFRIVLRWNIVRVTHLIVVLQAK